MGQGRGEREGGRQGGEERDLRPGKREERNDTRCQEYQKCMKFPWPNQEGHLTLSSRNPRMLRDMRPDYPGSCEATSLLAHPVPASGLVNEP